MFHVISIHALVKRATLKAVLLYRLLTISIHALVKRATLWKKKTDTERRDFNPRPREEGDLLRTLKEMLRPGISIHALVKRATGKSASYGGTVAISIHALVKRATKENSRFLASFDISIHALVKRATCMPCR